MTLHVEVVSPERILFEGDAGMVVVRTLGGGDIAFLTGHAPFLGALATWPMKIVLADGEAAHFAVHGGFVQVDGNRVIVLSDVAEAAGDIDADRARASRAQAEEQLRSDPDDAAAKLALDRANARLAVADAA